MQYYQFNRLHWTLFQLGDHAPQRLSNSFANGKLCIPDASGFQESSGESAYRFRVFFTNRLFPQMRKPKWDSQVMTFLVSYNVSTIFGINPTEFTSRYYLYPHLFYFLFPNSKCLPLKLRPNIPVLEPRQTCLVILQSLWSFLQK